MTVPLDTFSDQPLPAAASEEQYELYKAALEWRLAAPIVIRSADDIVSADRWRDRVQPFHHQVRNLITFCRLAPAVLLADEVGLGKTVSAGLILSELMARRRVARALVVCPRALCDQWVREMGEKFRIEARTGTGPELLAEARGEAPVVVTTYETVRDHMSHADMPTDAFQMLILDEAHRLRNLHAPGGPPRFAAQIRDVIRERWFTYVLMLTATPIQNRFTDIYALIDLLTLAKGHENPFGDPAAFRDRYLLRGHDGRRLQPGRTAHFRHVLNGYVTRTRRVDAELPFPTRDVVTLRVELTPGEREFEGVVGRVLGELHPLAQSSLGEALMSSPAALAAQLANMAGGRPAVAAAAVRARAVAEGPTPPAKLARLFALCDELRDARPDWRVVVFTRRRETQEMIRRGLEARGTRVGLIAGGRAAENRRDTAAFLADPPQVNALVSADVGAEGVNLQAANVLVNYDLPWNPMLLEQRIGRVQRLGSRHKSVQVLNLVAAGTVEEAVVARLLQRLMAVTETVGDLESILAGAGGDADDDSGERFEAVVRDLVVRSLQGQDTAQAAELRAASIERARREYDTHCTQINRDLGALDAGAAAAGPPPRFDRPPPSVSAEDFARRALTAEGHLLREVRPGLFRDERPRAAAPLVALSVAAAEAAASAGPAVVYAPGQPAFERLAERWAARPAHRVLDLRGATDAAAERLARRWCESYPGLSFRSCRVRVRKPVVNGRVLVRTTAENRVDQHDRLLEHAVRPEGHAPLAEHAAAAPVLGRAVRLQDVSPGAARRVQRAVADDEEVNAFVRYYAGRRVNELSRAGPNPHLRQRVEDDFSVAVGAEVAGFRGACYEEAVIDVSFAVEGREYEATLQAVPVSGQVIEKPTEDVCPVSGLRMPYGVLARCERTGRLFPRHRLHESEVSGRLAVREHTLLCEATGRLVIDDEVEACAVTGRRAVSAALVTCAASGHRVLRTETDASAVSGLTVRKDLLHPSERPPHRLGLESEFTCCAVSGRRLLTDEVGASAVSGRVVDRALLVLSEASGRAGLEDEAVRCQHTGRLLLRDEVGVCSVTGLCVDSTLLTRSEVSARLALGEHVGRCSVTGRAALLEELETCGLTGAAAARDQMETCAVSGLRVIRRRMVVCEVTNSWLSPTAAARSELSDRWVRPELLQRSDRPPHRAGLPDEVAVCEVSGRRLLLDEVARSVVSNRLIDRALLRGSSDRQAHPSEFVTCEQTGRQLLPDEAGRCELTGKLVGLHHLVRSEVSGRLVLRTHTERCAVTNRLAATDEVGTCSVTGARVSLAELETCAETGGVAVRNKLLRCAETGVWLVPAAAGKSDYSDRWVRRSLLRASEKPPGRLGTADEFGTCEVTRRALLRDELGRSAVSNKVVGRELLRASDGGGGAALPDELVRCEESQRLYLPSETGVCTATQKRVARELLDTHASGRLCLRRLLVTCPVSSRRVLQSETDVCAVTGLRVAATALGVCAVTGKRALPDRLPRCHDSGDRVLPSELGRSAYRPRPVKRSLLRPSDKPPGRLGTKEEFGTCEVSGKRLLLDEMARCAVTNRLADLDLLVTCGVSNRPALKQETYRCPWLGRRVIKCYLGACELTRVVVARRFLDEGGMLRPLAELLDGGAPDGAGRRDDLVPRLKEIDPTLFAQVVCVYAVESPGGDKLAVCATITERGWFGSKTRYAGFLLALAPDLRVAGDLVVGNRDRGEWQQVRTVSFA